MTTKRGGGRGLQDPILRATLEAICLHGVICF